MKKINGECYEIRLPYMFPRKYRLSEDSIIFRRFIYRIRYKKVLCEDGGMVERRIQFIRKEIN
jgi:hypothetical protein